MSVNFTSKPQVLDPAPSPANAERSAYFLSRKPRRTLDVDLDFRIDRHQEGRHTPDDVADQAACARRPLWPVLVQQQNVGFGRN